MRGHETRDTRPRRSVAGPDRTRAIPTLAVSAGRQTGDVWVRVKIIWFFVIATRLPGMLARAIVALRAGGRQAGRPIAWGW